MALQAAREGLRTLLVSTDPAHSTSDVLDTRLDGEAREVRPQLWALEIDPAEEADRYIEDVKARIADVTPPRLMAEVERQIDIARVTPGPRNPRSSTGSQESPRRPATPTTASSSTPLRWVTRSGCSPFRS